MKLDATDGALKISTKIKKTLPPVHRKASGHTAASGCRGKTGAVPPLRTDSGAISSLKFRILSLIAFSSRQGGSRGGGGGVKTRHWSNAERFTGLTQMKNFIGSVFTAA